MEETPFKLISLISRILALSIIIHAISISGISAEPSLPFNPHKGMCYAAWEKNRYSTKHSDRSLEKMASVGTEYIQIVTTFYQDNCNSPSIKRTDSTPSDRSLVHAIKKAHNMGLKVMLKPHIDIINNDCGTWCRADIGFAASEDWERWFSNYKKIILDHAAIAGKYKVEMFCVGTELSFTTQKEDSWRELIREVRKVYPGDLLYAANWDNYRNIRFWDELDYVGIDAYFPLTYRRNPSVTQIKRGWERWKREIRNFYRRVNKPVIFTEIGYPSASHAPSAPWKKGIGNADPDIQAKCYRAFFETMWGCPWLKGVYWWRWNTSIHSGGPHNRHFTPQNKPAEKILEAHYKGYRSDSTLAKAGGK